MEDEPLEPLDEEGNKHIENSLYTQVHAALSLTDSIQIAQSIEQFFNALVMEFKNDSVRQRAIDVVSKCGEVDDSEAGNH